MTDLAPAAELTGLSGPPVGFSLNRPSALTQLTNKYAPGSPTSSFLPSVNPIVARALANYDIGRVNQGQSPLTANQTRLAGSAANTVNVDQSLPFISHVTSHGITPEPTRPWWENAARDVQSIVSSIPKFPVAIAQEGANISQLPADYQAAMAKPTSNPFQTIGNLAQLPGVRLIPGAFTASQYGTGGAGTSALAEHPVMSLLDVLPYASKAASLTGTAAAAEDVAQRAAAITGEVPREPGPISSVLKYGHLRGGPIEGTVRQFGNVGEQIPALIPNTPTAAVRSVLDRASTTAPGRFAQSAFGQRSRFMARLQNRATSDVESAIEHGYIAPGMDGPMVQASVDALPAARALLNDFEDITPARKADIIGSLRDDSPINLSTPEARYVDTYKSAIDEYTNQQVASGELATIAYPHGPEVQLPNDAARIMKARAQAGQQAAVQHLRATLDPTTDYLASPDTIHADFTRAMADPDIPARVKKVLARGYVTALDTHGVDTAAARGVLASSPKAADLATLPATINPSATTPLAHTLGEYTTVLEPLRRQSVTVNRFLTNLQRGELSAAYRDVDAVAHQAGVQNLLSSRAMDITDLRASIGRQVQAQRAGQLLDRAGFTDTAARLADRTSTALDARLVPARWRGPLQSALESDATDLINQKAAAGEITSAQQSSMLDRATHRAFADLATDLPELRTMQAEVRNSWQELAAQGDGPVFIHDVHPTRVAASIYPKVTGTITTPSQLKSRLWDAGGTTEDIGMALNHQAVEHLTLQGNKAFVDQVVPHLTRTLSDIHAELEPAVERAYARNPTISRAGHMDALVAREFAPFNANDYLAGRTMTVGDPATQLMMPRDVLRNLERLRAGPGEFERITAAPMNLFRSSVLPLSPRWHVNNILGGLITTTARAENPLTIWRFARRAWNMTKEGGLDELARTLTDPEQIQAARLAAPGGAARQMSEWFRDAPLNTDAEKLSALHDYMAGSTLRRVWDDVRAKASSGIQKSYDFNQHFDDFYRNMAYLEGHEGALGRGLTEAESIRAGVGQMRKMLQSWDTLTPIERSVMRSIFPFYSWTRFMMKYVLTYPGDHPWRTSIMANLAQAETADLGSGLPQDLQSLLFLGGMDPNGNIHAVNTGGFNPFRDVGNYFTLGGFLAGGDGNVVALTSQVNPVISTLLQWAGVDPSNGVPELYPELKYDPTTGHLVAAPKENPLLGALGNFIPQTRAITAFAGINSQYRDLAANDPAAAGRYLASTVGVPVLSRDVNLPQKAFGTELTKYKSLTNDLSSSLAANDMGGFVARYPGLRAFAERIRVLQDDPAFQQRYGIQPGMSGTQQPSVSDVLAQIGKTAAPVPVG